MPKSLLRQLGEAVDEAGRAKLRVRIQGLIDKWSPRLGVSVNDWNIRTMKTYWGSCDPKARKLTFDSKLMSATPALQEMIVVHELMHLVTKDGGHDGMFYALMDKHLPNWRKLHAKYAGRMTPQS